MAADTTESRPSSAEEKKLAYYEAGQWTLVRRRFARHKVAVWMFWVVVLLYLLCINCEFFAPYEPNAVHKDYVSMPPQRVHFGPAPYVNVPIKRIDPVTLRREYSEDVQQPMPIRFFVRGLTDEQERALWTRGITTWAIARARIAEMGLSTLVVGDSETIKVHVHVPRPSAVLAYAETLGRLHDVVIEDMAAQYQQFLLGRTAPPIQAPGYNLKAGDIATLAVAPGDGLTRVFQSLGTTAIVPGGQTMNPSTHDFVQLLDALPTDRALLLPNNSNVILAARQAAELTKKHVRVVPTKTIPQGIAAMLAFNEQRDLETNAQIMEAAARHIQTGEVTTATRSVEFNGLKVEQGQVIGLLNDELATANATVEEAVWSLLDRMGAANLEIVTLYFGNGLTAGAAEILANAIRNRYSHLEVEVVEGGQPHYDYIISAE